MGVLDLVSYGAVLAELALVAVIARKGLQIRRSHRELTASGMDVYESLRASGRNVLGSFVGGVLAYEVAVFHYAVAGWGRPSDSGRRSFSVYRNTGYVALMIAVAIAAVIETVGVHLLVRLWSPAAAWVLTALSAYAIVWLLGDFHAVRLRPVLISADTLHLRLGLRWSIPVPLASIRAVGAAGAPVDRRQYLKAVLVGAPSRRIELTQPACAVGFYGRSRWVSTIDLQIDDPERFDAALERALGNRPAPASGPAIRRSNYIGHDPGHL